MKENIDNSVYSTGVGLRLTCCILLTAICSLIVWRLAIAYMPQNVIWSQNLTYSCSEQAPANWQVEDALEFEKLRLRNIANREFQDISAYLDFEASVESRAIKVQLLVSQEYLGDSQEQFDRDFNRYIDVIVKNPSVLDLSDEETERENSQEKLVSWFEQSRQKLAALNQSRNKLLLEISDCEQEILTIEIESASKLKDDLPSSGSDVIDIGIDINQLNIELAALDRQQQELNKKAAQAVEDDKLRDLERQSNKIFNRRLELIAEITEANELLSASSARVIPKGDPTELEKEKETSLRRVRERYDLARNKLNQLELEISDLQYDMGYLGQFLPEDALADEALSKKVSDSIEANIVLTLNVPDSGIEHSIVISGIQKFAILLAGCFGWCFGLLISSIGSGSKSDDLSEQSQDEQDQFADKPVVTDSEPVSVCKQSDIQDNDVIPLAEEQSIRGCESLSDIQEPIRLIENSFEQDYIEESCSYSEDKSFDEYFELDDDLEEDSTGVEGAEIDIEPDSEVDTDIKSESESVSGSQLFVDSDERLDFNINDSKDEISELANLNGFESWWVESYDRIAHKLSQYTSAMSDGIVFSSLEKAGLSPRFMINLSISLALSGNKVLLISASEDMVLERIFADFANQEVSDDSGQVRKIAERIFSGPGFRDCLVSDQPFARFASESPLDNLRFLHYGTRNIDKIDNNEFNNNVDYAEIDYETDFDCILVYMPELLAGGIGGFESRIGSGPITSVVGQFSNIVAVDFIEKPSGRKQASLRKKMKKHNCTLIEL